MYFLDSRFTKNSILFLRKSVSPLCTDIEVLITLSDSIKLIVSIDLGFAKMMKSFLYESFHWTTDPL